MISTTAAPHSNDCHDNEFHDLDNFARIHRHRRPTMPTSSRTRARSASRKTCSSRQVAKRTARRSGGLQCRRNRSL